MFRLITYPFNVSITLFISLCFALLNYSWFFDKIDAYGVGIIIMMIVLFALIGIYFNRKTLPESGPTSPYKNTWKKFLIVSFAGMILEFAIYGIPAISQGGREEFTGIPVLHVLFYSFVILSVLFSALYSGIRNALLCLAFSFVISFLLMSRQMMMVTFPLFIIAIVLRGELSKKAWLYIILSCVGVAVLFGILGNIRQQLSGDYVDDYIIKVGGATKEGASIGQSLYWIWLYTASPIYNFVLNLHSYETYGDVCNRAVAFGSCDGSYVMSVLMPEIITKYVGIDKFVEDLQMPHLNVSTAFAVSARLLGVAGVVMQILLSAVFYLLGYLLTSRNLKAAYITLYSSLSLYLAFDNKFIKTEFFFCFFIIFLMSFTVVKRRRPQTQTEHVNNPIG